MINAQQKTRAIRLLDILFPIATIAGLIALDSWEYDHLGIPLLMIAIIWCGVRYVAFGSGIPFTRIALSNDSFQASPDSSVAVREQVKNPELSRDSIPFVANETPRAEPSRLRYIGVWFLASFAGSILSNIAGLTLGYNYRFGNVTELLVISQILEVAIVSGVFILVYRWFDDLDMKAVMPYVYILGFIGMIIGIGSMAGDPLFRRSGSAVVLGSFASYIAIVVIIRWYFAPRITGVYSPSSRTVTKIQLHEIADREIGPRLHTQIIDALTKDEAVAGLSVQDSFTSSYIMGYVIGVFDSKGIDGEIACERVLKHICQGILPEKLYQSVQKNIELRKLSAELSQESFIQDWEQGGRVGLEDSTGDKPRKLYEHLIS